MSIRYQYAQCFECSESASLIGKRKFQTLINKRLENRFQKLKKLLNDIIFILFFEALSKEDKERGSIVQLIISTWSRQVLWQVTMNIFKQISYINLVRFQFSMLNYFAMKRKILNENQKPMEIFEHSKNCVQYKEVKPSMQKKCLTFYKNWLFVE